MPETIQFGTFPVFFSANSQCRLLPPYPARTKLPHWVRWQAGQMQTNDPAGQAGTLAASGPFLKTITQGFIIPAPFDFHIDLQVPDDGEAIFPQKLPKDIDPEQYEFWAPFPDGHMTKQIAGSPWENAPWVIKLRGFWYIETPPGYSCLFMSPQKLTGENLPFYALPGIVETDRYKNLISFPMIPQHSFPMVVPGGTPLVQVIPFKRSDWKSEIRCLDDDT